MRRSIGCLLLISSCAASQTPWWRRSTYQPAEEARVSGTVRAQDIVPRTLAGVHVEASLEGRVVAETTTDEVGRYQLEFEGALGTLCVSSGRQQGKKTPHWSVALRLTKPGFEDTVSGATVPRTFQPVDVYMNRAP